MLHSKCLHLCCTRILCLTSVHMHYYAVFNCTITDSFSIGPLLSPVQRMGSTCLMSPYSVFFFSCIVQCVTIALFTACYSNPAEAIIIHFLVVFFPETPVFIVSECSLASAWFHKSPRLDKERSVPPLCRLSVKAEDSSG